MEDNVKYIHLTTLTFPHEVEMLRTMLDSDGVETFSEGDHIVSAIPVLSNGVGGIKVWIKEVDLEEALSTLSRYKESQRIVEDEKSKNCPHCDSENVRREKNSVIFVIFLILTIGGLSFLYPWNRYKCNDCDKWWS